MEQPKPKPTPEQEEQIAAAVANREIVGDGSKDAWDAYMDPDSAAAEPVQRFKAVAPSEGETSQPKDVDPRLVGEINEVGAAALKGFEGRTLEDEMKDSSVPSVQPPAQLVDAPAGYRPEPYPEHPQQ